MSHARARALGWRRIDPRPWGKCGASWEGPRGWSLRHCGHPTALYPWVLYAPDGATVGTGAENGHPERGTAWDSLARAFAFVATQIRPLAEGSIAALAQAARVR